MSEFHIPKGENASADQFQFQWLYMNGLLGIIFSVGLVITALKSRDARSWRYGPGTHDFFVLFLLALLFLLYMLTQVLAGIYQCVPFASSTQAGLGVLLQTMVFHSWLLYGQYCLSLYLAKFLLQFQEDS